MYIRHFILITKIGCIKIKTRIINITVRSEAVFAHCDMCTSLVRFIRQPSYDPMGSKHVADWIILYSCQ